MNRRSLFKNFVFFLAQSHFLLRKAWAAEPNSQSWIQAINVLSFKLIQREIKPIDWYHEMEKIYAQVSPEQIFGYAGISPESIDKLIDPTSNKPTVYKINEPFGLHSGIRLHPRIMYLRKGISNTPHAHIDMVSCHYVIDGEMLLKQYDRVKIEEQKIQLVQTNEKIIKKGDVVAMCEQKNNVHWFTAIKNSATFNIPVCNLGLTKSQNPNIVALVDHKLLFMDPRKQPDQNGVIITDLISAEESAKRFNT